ncbi:MAG: VWA domain-containing protein [Acidobacteriota bacterium]
MSRRRPPRAVLGSIAIAAVALAALFAAPITLGDEPASGAGPEVAELESTGESAVDLLDDRHRRFLEEVEPLLTSEERAAFLTLGHSYRRDAFIRRFWRLRDPQPRTSRNELRDLWQERARRARELDPTLTSDPARAVLLFGEPRSRRPISCSALRHRVELWSYPDGTDRLAGPLFLVFQRVRQDELRLWTPARGLLSLLSLEVRPGRTRDQQLATLGSACLRGDELIGALSQTISDDRFAPAVVYTPPGAEWIRTFVARSTELPDDAGTLDGSLALTFPGRHQSRTVVQATVALPRTEVTASDLATLNFVVDGEVLRSDDGGDERLFEHFRYRFDLPAATLGDRVPLVLQRPLRPGDYRLIVRVEDVNAGRFYREARAVTVPRVEARRVAKTIAEDGTVHEVELHSTGTDDPSDLAARAEAAGFAEANASISTGDHSVRLLPLSDELQVGRVRVEARTRGDDISRVAFSLDGKQIFAKRRPPYSVELDLGSGPDLHIVRADAFDAEGTRLASDEMAINAGPHRFGVRLIEPQAGGSYQQSVRVHAAVEVPEGEQLDRVEIFLEDTRLATLYQPPFEQPILLPEPGATTFVRAVAHLVNGGSAEDAHLINAPDVTDEYRVQFVELFVSAIDRDGGFVEDLKRDELEVLENGVRQEIRRFEAMRELPIRASLVIDTSQSMEPSLRDVERAAYRFLEEVVTERDRAAVVTFADEPELRVRFTNDREILAGGLGGLSAEGETALWDALLFSLHYMSGIPGKKALVLLTDGEDSGSRYTFDETLAFARRTGVAVYVIGLGLVNSQLSARGLMTKLARETGGDVFFIESSKRLEKIYDLIQLELRSQILVGYQSSLPSDSEGFRTIELRTARGGLELRTIPGYFP